MAWQYADFEAQATDPARLTRLRLHIGEVQQKIGQDVSADGKSVNHASLVAYLGMLRTRRAELEHSPQVGTNGGISLADFGSTRRRAEA